MNPRVVTVAVGVLAAHAIMLTAAWLHRSAPPPPKLVEVQSITAQLITPAPVPQVAVASVQQPAPPKPAPHVKPKVEPKPVPKVAKPVPQPVTTSPEPSPTPAPAPVAATPAPETPAPAAPAAAPGPARETMHVGAPKNVQALQCTLVKPDYPSMSRRRGETGTAYVHFVVGVTGKIENITLQKSSGYPRLDEAALEAMRASSCPPYMENGQAIRVAHTQPYNFGLTD